MWRQTYQLEHDGKIVIDQTSGRVYATTWDQPHVQITAEGDEPHRYLRVRAKARKILVDVERPMVQLFSLGGPRIDLDVRLPAGCHLAIDNGAGKVDVENLDARSLVVSSGVGAVDCSLSRIYRGGRYVVDAGAGEAKVQVPRNAGLDITIDHGLGRVVSDVGLVEGRGRINGGGADLVMDVGVGSLEIALGPEQLEGDHPGRPPAPPPPVAPAAPSPPVMDETSAHAGAGAPGVPGLDGDEVHRVLRMVEEGKLSPDEAEAILRVLEEGNG